jgi:CBS domain-containing protein
MTVGQISRTEVDVARSNDTAKAAGQRMLSRNVGSLVVVDENGAPLGVLTDRDLALRVVGQGLDPNSVEVAEVMTQGPVTIAGQRPVEEALAVMRRRGVRRLVVLDRDQCLDGVVSLDDVLVHLAEEMHQASVLLTGTSLRSPAEA